MGKYMKKSKITGDIAVMELSTGVLTRAKTLALKRLLKPSSSSPQLNSDHSSSFCYLELRSRRLEKPPPIFKQHHQHHKDKDKDKSCIGDNTTPNSKANSSLRMGSVNSGSVGSVSLSCDKKDMERCFVKHETTEVNVNEVGVEASFGENSLEFEPRDRSTRESTPCSLIRSSDTIRTPGSTTRRTNSTATYHGGRSDVQVQRIIPTTREMEEFFACAEQKQRRLFIEKYNFDTVNDLPLPGRYEWVQVIP